MTDISIVKRRAWPPGASVLLCWGGVMVVGLLASIMSGTSLPAFIDVVVTRPIHLFIILHVAALASSMVFRSRFEQRWHEGMGVFPFALLIAVLLSWFGIWNDGSGTIALSLHDAFVFIATFGIFPTALGPDILLRGTAVALIAILAFQAWRKGMGPGRTIAFVVAAWIPASIALLIQTWMAQVISLFRDVSIAHSLDASRVLSLALTNSYWSNFQADRFFTGIGKQLETSAALSSASVLFLIALLLLPLAVLRLPPMNRPGVPSALMKRIVGIPFLILASPLAIGLIIGFRMQHLSWHALDVVALLLLIIAFKTWFIYWTFGRELDDLPKDEREHPERPLPSGIVRPEELETLREVLISVALICGLLLGWPVLLTVLCLLVLGWMSSSRSFGWAQSRRARVPVWAAMSACLVMAGGTFAARSSTVPTTLFPLALAWAIVTATVMLLPLFPVDTPAHVKKTLGLVAVGGILVALVLKTAVVLALTALLLLGLFFLQKNPKNWRRYAALSLIAFGIAATLLCQFRLP